MTPNHTKTPYNPQHTPVVLQRGQKGQTLPNEPEQEYLTRFDLKTAFTNADKYIENYNKGLDAVKDHIRGGTLATLFRIVEAFVRQNNYLQLLVAQPVPCRLNNCMLAYQLKVNRRTIINHLNKLEKAGFLTKTFRGTFADYELLVAPAVLLNKPEFNTNHPEKEQAVDTEPSHNVKNVPPISLFINLEKSNIHPKPCELVENGGSEEKNSGQAPLSLADNTPLGQFSCYTPKASVGGVENQTLSTAKYREHDLGAAGGEKNTNKTAKKKFPAWQLAMVQDFYRYAMPLLYPYHEFDPQMKAKILNKLFTSVYGGFKEPNFTRKHWEQYQKNLMERIDMVAVWKDKPVEGDKYRFLVNPLTYFDSNCEYGFVKTEEWLIKKSKQMALVKAEIELEKARKEMLKEGDRLRIYHKWEKRFKNKKLAEIMPVFYRAMARIQQQLTEVNGRLTMKNANLQQLTTIN